MNKVTLVPATGRLQPRGLSEVLAERMRLCKGWPTGDSGAVCIVLWGADGPTMGFYEKEPALVCGGEGRLFAFHNGSWGWTN